MIMLTSTHQRIIEDLKDKLYVKIGELSRKVHNLEQSTASHISAYHKAHRELKECKQELAKYKRPRGKNGRFIKK